MWWSAASGEVVFKHVLSFELTLSPLTKKNHAKMSSAMSLTPDSQPVLKLSHKLESLVGDQTKMENIPVGASVNTERSTATENVIPGE